MCILPLSEVLPVSRSTSWRIPKITNYTLSQYIMCEYCIELTQLVWDKRVIVNFMYPPLLRGPPCCKVHQWEDTHYQGAHNHTHNEQHILGPLMMVCQYPHVATYAYILLE